MQIIRGNSKALGDGFEVARILPQVERRSIGPFVFFDYFGPVDFPPGKGVDVRPHPHIGLATITYLFEGSQIHRDSLGTVQTILPGDVNWMTAGRGIVHSERTDPDARASGHRMHGIQSWVGLPRADEETAPRFQHVAKNDLPTHNADGVQLRVLAGAAFGLRAPIKVFSPIFYVHATFAAGTRLDIPTDYPERAIFVTAGTIRLGDEQYGPGTMAVLADGEATRIDAPEPAQVMLLGGAPLDGARHLWWNFVSSSKDRIEKAKADWKAQRLGRIDGDAEFIPLPQ